MKALMSKGSDSKQESKEAAVAIVTFCDSSSAEHCVGPDIAAHVFDANNLNATAVGPCTPQESPSRSMDQTKNMNRSDSMEQSQQLLSFFCANDESPEKIECRVKSLKEYKDAIIRLCNDTIDYESRIDQLSIAWSNVAELVRSTSEGCQNIMRWALRHTLHLMLVGEWNTLSDQRRNDIRIKIEEILPEIGNSPSSVNRCLYIIKYFDSPWGDKRLLSILHGDAKLLTKCDLEFLTAERGCMIVLRLQKLCETKCDEVAFTWCSKALMALRIVDGSHELRKSTSVGHIYFIFDIYLCLVHKYIGVHKFIEEVKRLDLDDALLLIRRNVYINPNEPSRIIKFRAKVAKLSANITIAAIMVENLTKENEQFFCAILREWLNIHKEIPVQKFRVIARKLFETASSPKHIYLACNVIKIMRVSKWRDLLLELYVRIITGELNELELLKSEKTCSAEVIIEHEMNLSHHYLNIADLLKFHHPYLTYECILTAFSLNPTTVNYNLVEAVALSKEIDDKSINIKDSPKVSCNFGSNSIGNGGSSTDFSCTKLDETEIVATVSTVTVTTTITTMTTVTVSSNPTSELSGGSVSSTLSALHSITGSNQILESPNYDALAAPSLILDSIETIDLPDHIRIDLSVLLSSPRVKFLSWVQPWSELEVNCQRLLKPGGKLEIVRQSLAVANDHLQFLNLDYNQFRNLPESDVPGIEKGYECYVDSDEDGSVRVSAISTNPDSDLDFDMKGGAKRKRLATTTGKKRGRKPKAIATTISAASLSAVTSSSMPIGYSSSHFTDSASLNFDPTNQLLSPAFAQLLRQHPNLVSPFNNFLLQHLRQRSNSGEIHQPIAELDTLFRSFYIQQLQAQLQLSQSYTAALQQTLSSEQTQDNAQRLKLQQMQQQVLLLQRQQEIATKLTTQEQMLSVGSAKSCQVIIPQPLKHPFVGLKVIRKVQPSSKEFPRLPLVQTDSPPSACTTSPISLPAVVQEDSSNFAVESSPTSEILRKTITGLASVSAVPKFTSDTTSNFLTCAQLMCSAGVSATSSPPNNHPLNSSLGMVPGPSETSGIKATKSHVAINDITVAVDDLPQSRLPNTSETVTTSEIQSKLVTRFDSMCGASNSTTMKAAPDKAVARVDQMTMKEIPSKSLDFLGSKDIAVYRSASDRPIPVLPLIRTLTTVRGTNPTVSKVTVPVMSAIIRQQQARSIEKLKSLAEASTSTTAAASSIFGSKGLIPPQIDPKKVIFVKRIVPAGKLGQPPGQKPFTFSGIFPTQSSSVKPPLFLSSSPKISPPNSSTESAPESRKTIMPLWQPVGMQKQFRFGTAGSDSGHLSGPIECASDEVKTVEMKRPNIVILSQLVLKPATSVPKTTDITVTHVGVVSKKIAEPEESINFKEPTEGDGFNLGSEIQGDPREIDEYSVEAGLEPEQEHSDEYFENKVLDHQNSESRKFKIECEVSYPVADSTIKTGITEQISFAEFEVSDNEPNVKIFSETSELKADDATELRHISYESSALPQQQVQLELEIFHNEELEDAAKSGQSDERKETTELRSIFSAEPRDKSDSIQIQLSSSEDREFSHHEFTCDSQMSGSGSDPSKLSKSGNSQDSVKLVFGEKQESENSDFEAEQADESPHLSSESTVLPRQEVRPDSEISDSEQNVSKSLEADDAQEITDLPSILFTESDKFDAMQRRCNASPSDEAKCSQHVIMSEIRTLNSEFHSSKSENSDIVADLGIERTSKQSQLDNYPPEATVIVHSGIESESEASLSDSEYSEPQDNNEGLALTKLTESDESENLDSKKSPLSFGSYCGSEGYKCAGPDVCGKALPTYKTNDTFSKLSTASDVCCRLGTASGSMDRIDSTNFINETFAEVVARVNDQDEEEVIESSGGQVDAKGGNENVASQVTSLHPAEMHCCFSPKSDDVESIFSKLSQAAREGHEADDDGHEADVYCLKANDDCHEANEEDPKMDGYQSDNEGHKVEIQCQKAAEDEHEAAEDEHEAAEDDHEADGEGHKTDDDGHEADDEGHKADDDYPKSDEDCHEADGNDDEKTGQQASGSRRQINQCEQNLSLHHLKLCFDEELAQFIKDNGPVAYSQQTQVIEFIMNRIRSRIEAAPPFVETIVLSSETDEEEISQISDDREVVVEELDKQNPPQASEAPEDCFKSTMPVDPPDKESKIDERQLSIASESLDPCAETKKCLKPHAIDASIQTSDQTDTDSSDAPEESTVSDAARSVRNETNQYTDSDSDSAKSGDFVVQKPQRTYSKKSSTSECSNASGQVLPLPEKRPSQADTAECSSDLTKELESGKLQLIEPSIELQLQVGDVLSIPEEFVNVSELDNSLLNSSGDLVVQKPQRTYGKRTGIFVSKRKMLPSVAPPLDCGNSDDSKQIVIAVVPSPQMKTCGLLPPVDSKKFPARRKTTHERSSSKQPRRIRRTLSTSATHGGQDGSIVEVSLPPRRQLPMRAARPSQIQVDRIDSYSSTYDSQSDASQNIQNKDLVKRLFKSGSISSGRRSQRRRRPWKNLSDFQRRQPVQVNSSSDSDDSWNGERYAKPKLRLRNMFDMKVFERNNTSTPIPTGRNARPRCHLSDNSKTIVREYDTQPTGWNSLRHQTPVDNPMSTMSIAASCGTNTAILASLIKQSTCFEEENKIQCSSLGLVDDRQMSVEKIGVNGANVLVNSNSAKLPNQITNDECRPLVIRLNRLSNATLLRYGQTVLVNDCLVRNPTIKLKRIQKHCSGRVSIQQQPQLRFNDWNYNQHSTIPTSSDLAIFEFRLAEFGHTTTTSSATNYTSHITMSNSKNVQSAPSNRAADDINTTSRSRPVSPVQNIETTQTNFNVFIQSERYDINVVQIESDFNPNCIRSLRINSTRKFLPGNHRQTTVRKLDQNADLLDSIAARLVSRSLMLNYRKNRSFHQIITRTYRFWLHQYHHYRNPAAQQMCSYFRQACREIHTHPVNLSRCNCHQLCFRKNPIIGCDAKLFRKLNEKLMTSSNWLHSLLNPSLPAKENRKFPSILAQLFDVADIGAHQQFSIPEYYCLPVVRIENSAIHIEENSTSIATGSNFPAARSESVVTRSHPDNSSSRSTETVDTNRQVMPSAVTKPEILNRIQCSSIVTKFHKSSDNDFEPLQFIYKSDHSRVQLTPVNTAKCATADQSSVATNLAVSAATNTVEGAMISVKPVTEVEASSDEVKSIVPRCARAFGRTVNNTTAVKVSRKYQTGFKTHANHDSVERRTAKPTDAAAPKVMKVLLTPPEGHRQEFCDFSSNSTRLIPVRPNSKPARRNNVLDASKIVGRPISVMVSPVIAATAPFPATTRRIHESDFRSTLDQLREFETVFERIKEQSVARVVGQSTMMIPDSGPLELLSHQSNPTVNPMCVILTATTPAVNSTVETTAMPSMNRTRSLKHSTTISTSLKLSSAVPAETSTISLPLNSPVLKPIEDEQTVQRIYGILAEYAEQLRNSPDVNNKPAPRRRSNTTHQLLQNSGVTTNAKTLSEPSLDSVTKRQKADDIGNQIVAATKRNNETDGKSTILTVFQPSTGNGHSAFVLPNRLILPIRVANTTTSFLPGQKFPKMLTASTPTSSFTISDSTHIHRSNSNLSMVADDSASSILHDRRNSNEIVEPILLPNNSNCCNEDLGVGEPSTRDLFPDSADYLYFYAAADESTAFSQDIMDIESNN